jgi:hypothetical protein
MVNDWLLPVVGPWSASYNPDSRHKWNIAHRNRICKTDELEPAWSVQDTMLQALMASTSTPTPPPFRHIRFQVFRLVNFLLIYEPFRRINFSNITTCRPARHLTCDATRKKTLAGLVASMREQRNLYKVFVGKPRDVITGYQSCQIYKYTAR